MKTKLIAICSLVLALASFGFAQTTTTSTTLAAAITSTSADRVSLAAGTNVAANGQLFVDQELMYVVGAVNGSTTVWQVQRGAGGTAAVTHSTSTTVWVAPPGNALRVAFVTSPPQAGSCTNGSGAFAFSPVIHVTTGDRYQCVSSQVTRVHTGVRQMVFCGATTGTTTCADTVSGSLHVVGGIATLASNAATISAISPAFTGVGTFSCVGNDITTRANPVQVVQASSSSITITNTTGASDVINWVCIGY